MDFSVVENIESFIDIIKVIKKELILAGYDISISYNDDKTVKNAFIKFEKLMYECGISPLPTQKFSIKIEIDTNPPKGANLETHIVNKYFPISFLSYNLSSLFAGKLHALLTRKYTKGRDYFDIGWYLSKWENICPNIKLLENALKQTNWKGDIPSKSNWKDYLYDLVESTDWKKVKQDAENFLENQQDLNIFTKENILNLIKR